MRRQGARKLLVASLGVAAVSYACARKAAEPHPEPVGNLVAPDPVPTASGEPTEPDQHQEPVGNLVAPPPPEPDSGARQK